MPEHLKAFSFEEAAAVVEVLVCVCCLRKQFKKIFEIRMNITSAGIVKRNNIVLLVFNLSSIQYFRIIIRTK